MIHLQVSHGQLPSNRGMVIRGCDRYLRHEADYFIDVYEERRPPGGPRVGAPMGAIFRAHVSVRTCYRET